MKCLNCNETEHEPTAKYCHVCGMRLSRLPNQDKPASTRFNNVPTKERHVGVVVVSVLLLLVVSLVEWGLFEEYGILSIIWNVIMFIGFWADWNKFKDDSVASRIKPYLFMVPMTVAACIFENLLFFPQWAIIITIPIILLLTELFFKRRKNR